MSASEPSCEPQSPAALPNPVRQVRQLGEVLVEVPVQVVPVQVVLVEVAEEGLGEVPVQVVVEDAPSACWPCWAM